ncbi:MAG: 23S rRNA (pseudouridine(1915)-N(3))-methyltransferase RlmH [Alicyclobacillus mali]|uniref:23S rRNA (pseudouridine(1915)-N(3))-methyltransferase RlmH n=1 Tax=Alicyclobacillus mali (ex Roth et al. 2021) TaxID=1123961 RepID=UPI0023F1CB46|nr:23S rRNA (pseudouridine(1915)-N(3))-methyltransferase RlmH [Alicyclobacillus mali (ex Roth et al. 2021)]MCL6488593.1 23S rRNA (pseudouridine(1915)-N(3))-methyltransferase RlmH [Alicyclobacillus mali (ex Roth et al. 2021)]
MRVAVIAVGRIREKFWLEALREYEKRLSAYVDLEMMEVADESDRDEMSPTEVEALLSREADRIERWLRPRDGVIVLDIDGEALSSEAWSERYDRICTAGHGRLVFVVGGSRGLHPRIKRRAVFRWSFGPITLPHALARIVLLEQLYRGIRILRGEPYHK